MELPAIPHHSVRFGIDDNSSAEWTVALLDTILVCVQDCRWSHNTGHRRTVAMACNWDSLTPVRSSSFLVSERSFDCYFESRGCSCCSVQSEAVDSILTCGYLLFVDGFEWFCNGLLPIVRSLELLAWWNYSNGSVSVYLSQKNPLVWVANVWQCMTLVGSGGTTVLTSVSSVVGFSVWVSCSVSIFFAKEG